MSIQLNVEVHEVNTIIEGLIRVQDNAARIQNEVRVQASVQLELQQKAAEEAHRKSTEDGGTASA